MIKWYNPARTRDLLHELNALRIVFLLRLLIARKRRVPHGLAEELETFDIERDRVFLATKVFNRNVGVLHASPILLALASYRIGVHVSVRLGAVCWWEEVDELGERGC